MNRKHKYKLALVTLFLVVIAAACSLIFYALNQNLNLFYTPSELLAANLPDTVQVRVGGMVLPGTLQTGADLKIKFAISDYQKELLINYQGILPDLFREGQGVVALGTLNEAGIFEADQILAKHDENYMPPELAPLMDKA